MESDQIRRRPESQREQGCSLPLEWRGTKATPQNRTRIEAPLQNPTLWQYQRRHDDKVWRRRQRRLKPKPESRAEIYYNDLLNEPYPLD